MSKFWQGMFSNLVANEYIKKVKHGSKDLKNINQKYHNELLTGEADKQ